MIAASFPPSKTVTLDLLWCLKKTKDQWACCNTWPAWLQLVVVLPTNKFGSCSGPDIVQKNFSFFLAFSISHFPDWVGILQLIKELPKVCIFTKATPMPSRRFQQRFDPSLGPNTWNKSTDEEDGGVWHKLTRWTPLDRTCPTLGSDLGYHKPLFRYFRSLSHSCTNLTRLGPIALSTQCDSSWCEISPAEYLDLCLSQWLSLACQKMRFINQKWCQSWNFEQPPFSIFATCIHMRTFIGLNLFTEKRPHSSTSVSYFPCGVPGPRMRWWSADWLDSGRLQVAIRAMEPAKRRGKTEQPTNYRKIPRIRPLFSATKSIQSYFWNFLEKCS